MRNNADAVFLQGLSPKEYQSLLLGSFSVLIYVISAYSIRYYQLSNLFYQVVYGASVSVFPMILLLCYRKCIERKTGDINALGKMFFFINVLSLYLISLVVFFSCTIRSIGFALLGYFVLVSFSLLFKIYNTLIFANAYKSKYAANLTFCCLVFFIPACFFIALSGIFSKEWVFILKGLFNLGSYVYLLFFLLLALLSAVIVSWIFFSKRVEKIKENKMLTLLICFSPIFLFDVMNNFDIEHYNAYLAPALAVLNGKIPLVDVFCHYGLSYLVFTITYIFLPNNYAVISVVVSVLNIICWITFLLMLRNMIKNPMYFSILAISSVFGVNYLFGHSINMVPSALSMRYLPTILLSYFLLIKLDSRMRKESDPKLFNSLSFNAILLVNVLWSFESLVSLCVIYLAYLWISPISLKIFLIKFFQFFLCILMIFLSVILIYAFFFKEAPNYLGYMNFISSYMNPYSKIGDKFLLLKTNIYRESFFWIFFAALNLVCFFYFLMYRMGQKIIDSYFKKAIFISIVSIVFMSYFVLQASFVTMMISGYPSFILLFSVLIMAKENSHCFMLKMSSNITLSIMAFVFCVSVFKTLSVEYPNLYRNGDIFYAAFHKRGFTLDNFIYNLTNFCSRKQPSPGSMSELSVEENTCKKNRYHQELSDVIKKWYSDKKEILLFHRDLVESLIENNKVHLLLINPVNDSVVESLYLKKMEHKMNNIHEGDVVVVDKDFNFFPIDFKILEKLNVKFTFKLIEETEHLRVFRLNRKSVEQESDLNLPIPYKIIQASVDYKPIFQGEEAKIGVVSLLDKDKGTAWFVNENALFNKNVFSIWIDLENVFYLSKIKVWRKIDFRNPNNTWSESLGFLSNFNIEISEDNYRWSIVSSEKGFLIGDKNYYNLILNYKKARYIRLNVLSESLREFSVSEIEVFGKGVI